TPKPKKPSAQRRATYAEGSSTRMFGEGDRTKVATEDSAGEQTPGRTSQKSRHNPKFAEGGLERGMYPRQAAEPAEPGQVGTKATPAGSPRASGGLDAIGGLARPAKPGQTGC